MAEPLEAVVAQALRSTNDGAGGISESELASIRSAFERRGRDSAALAFLRDTRPQLYTALTNDLGYEHYVGFVLGTLQMDVEGYGVAARDDARRRDLAQRGIGPSTGFRADGLPATLPGGEPAGRSRSGVAQTAFTTGKNRTTIPDGRFAPTSEADVAARRQAQAAVCTRMAAVLGVDVANPPGLGVVRAFLQALVAGGAAPEQVRAEYAAYLQKFFVHAGGGVEWDVRGGGLISADRVEALLCDQPRLRDGRTVIDCEGFSAITERVFAGLQRAGSSEPMFDVVHSANNCHVVTGVFVRGRPTNEGFVVTNSYAVPIRLTPQQAARCSAPDASSRAAILGLQLERDTGIQGGTQSGPTIAGVIRAVNDAMR